MFLWRDKRDISNLGVKQKASYLMLCVSILRVKPQTEKGKLKLEKIYHWTSIPGINSGQCVHVHSLISLQCAFCGFKMSGLIWIKLFDTLMVMKDLFEKVNFR